MNKIGDNIEVDLYTKDVGDVFGKVQLIEYYGSDLTVVNAARVSFGTTKNDLDDRDKKLIDYLIRNQHTSTLEHCGVTFKFIVPLYVANQHMRHRTWSYNSISRRYTDADIKFYEPLKFRTQHKSNRQASNQNDLIDPVINITVHDGHKVHEHASHCLRAHNAQSLKLYHDMIAAGICREQARGVLPCGMYTEYYGTVNLHNALKFIDARTHEGAQWEIQQVAYAMKEIMSNLFPITMQTWQKIQDERLQYDNDQQDG